MEAARIVAVIILFGAAILVCFGGLYMIEYAIVQGSENIKVYNNAHILTPWTLHNGTRLNIVGCWAIFILFRLINPIGTLVFLAVVGRK